MSSSAIVPAWSGLRCAKPCVVTTVPGFKKWARVTRRLRRMWRASIWIITRALKNFNSAFVSRDRREAEAGDLLFYYQPWVQKFPYHVMIFLGGPHVAPNGAQDWVVYHTGSSPTDQGTVKKVELSVLDHHPDPRWRPVESNRNFLGFYRLKILE